MLQHTTVTEEGKKNLIRMLKKLLIKLFSLQVFFPIQSPKIAYSNTFFQVMTKPPVLLPVPSVRL